MANVFTEAHFDWHDFDWSEWLWLAAHLGVEQRPDRVLARRAAAEVADLFLDNS